MKKHFKLLVAIGLCLASLTACDKNNQDDNIKIIEASNVAESKETKEVEYKQPTMNETQESDLIQVENENSLEQDDTGEAVSEMDPTIYDIWMSDLGSSLQIYNSTSGIQFELFDATTEEYIVGNATTDNTSYIEVTYIKPVEKTEDEQVIENEEIAIEESSINNYGSDEEFYAAQEKEQAELYQTIRYDIVKNEFDSETSTMYLTLKYEDKVYELYTLITTLTPDYSSDDNMITAEEDDAETAIQDELVEE